MANRVSSSCVGSAWGQARQKGTEMTAYPADTGGCKGYIIIEM